MRKDTICTPVLFLFSLLLLPSCVATQQDVLALNRQIRTLNKEVANMKSVREKQAETGAEIDSVKQEIQRVSGGQEENKNLIKHIIERDTSEQEDQNARPLPIFVPTYGHGMKGKEILAAGMKVYDLLTADRNRGITDPGRHIPHKHRTLLPVCFP